MRTEEQIAERLAGKARGFFGFDVEVLVRFVSFETASPKLTEEARNAEGAKDEWERERLPLDESVVKKDMAEYMEFAWDKASDHRGLSAHRSLEKMEAYLWILGDDELIEKLEDVSYANYGCPRLAAICEKYDLPIPQDEGVQNMINSKPCGGYEGCGCGEP
jgi:hypothetical protein